MAIRAALSILADIRAKVLAHAAPLPSERSANLERKGVGLQIAGVRVVCPMDEVAEVHNLLKPTWLPAVKDWMLGVANIRGRLVPIVDLPRYLGVPPSTPRNQWRIVVVEDGELSAGLVVERSLGIQHFAQDSFEEADDEGRFAGTQSNQALTPYLSGVYRTSGRVFFEARLKRILRDERFLDVGA
jgi:twitching motility protein PilI